jgi:hypothetical protein
VLLVAPCLAVVATSACSALVGLGDHELFPTEAGAIDAGATDAGAEDVVVDARGPRLVQQRAIAATDASTVAIELAAPPSDTSALVLTTTAYEYRPKSVTGAGVSWTSAAETGQHVVSAVWVGFDARDAGTTISLTLPGTERALIVYVSEWAGIAALDAAVTKNGPPGTMSTAPLTTKRRGELLFAAAATHSDVFGPPGGGFLPLDGRVVADIQALHAYRVVDDVGTYTAEWAGALDGWDTSLLGLVLR